MKYFINNRDVISTYQGLHKEISLISHITYCVEDRHLAFLVQLLRECVQGYECSGSANAGTTMNQDGTALQ